MGQTAEEYMWIIYESEMNTFGFTGTRVPPHIKDITFSFEDHMIPQEMKERLENIACTRIDERKSLPPQIHLDRVDILCCDDTWLLFTE